MNQTEAKRLEVAVFGELYTVGAIRMDKVTARKALEVYGRQQWNALARDIAIGRTGNGTAAKVSHTLGRPVKCAYRCTGILMQSRRFGMETFWGGLEQVCTQIGSEFSRIRPENLPGGNARDIVAVFRERSEGSLFFRWSVAEFDCARLGLIHHDVSPLLDHKRPFELVRSVACMGGDLVRREIDATAPWTPMKHVFHVLD